ncbi:ABC transporter ATP-binding protein [Actinocorallia sp. API 0066]|uniref:ABC transporter ATP-binding protein n=1 Tax=Actinocorallia sp. API 0066 TaxID=2896846 RepID=UPI001E4A5038|nr:ABC transporter ATP-binding protein [Actinocorallia sp. API 0066]MCD0448299.1 ABC transporter ATP-binding protein [Actinocorallia sp. API 0066]
MSVLDLRDVHRDFGSGASLVRALRGLSLTVEAGEFVAVMGASGSGKTTLLNVAGGLDRPTRGEVLVADRLLTGDRAALAALRRRTVGYVFQDLNLIPALSALENVMLPRELDGVRTAQARTEAAVALADVGLADAASRFPDELSGGQRQRVAIARALVGSRALLLADEPAGALDSTTGEDIMKLLRARCDSGASCLMATHESRHAAYADRVLFLQDGTLTESPTPSAPAHTKEDA